MLNFKRCAIQKCASSEARKRHGTTWSVYCSKRLIAMLNFKRCAIQKCVSSEVRKRHGTAWSVYCYMVLK